MTAAAAHRCLRFDVSLPEYQAQHRGTPSLMKTNTSASSRRILDSASNEVDHDNSDTEEAPRRPARIAVISSADINRVEATDDSNEFGAAESDAENDGGASDWDDSELDEGGTNDHKGEADGVGELLEPVFDESLLEALTNAESGMISTNVLKVSYSPFSYLNQPYEPRSIESFREDYSWLHGGPYGPTPGAMGASATVFGEFSTLFNLDYGNGLLK
ncbi:hypothetical protein PC128_g6868 [Phytophthora cactorum]|nr:hypothetical protein PC128_g6868 [Phytophthora cactorum]